MDTTAVPVRPAAGTAPAHGAMRAERTLTDRRPGPVQFVLLLILGTLLLRLCFAATLGLGIDESYMVAAGRVLRFGYFDHPPASWWLSWAASHLFGSDAAVVVRLPFILLFALSTWLMFRLGSYLHSARAGLWAAVAFNLSPVFSVTTGSWVLPDGPLMAGLLGAALCLAHALDATGDRAWRWWLGAGACAGLALFSKYSAVLTLGGAGLYLLTAPRHRVWLHRPQPWAALVLAALIFIPVVAWNAAHGWASFAFQGGRASGGVEIHPLRPFVVLGGEALFVLPWIWLPQMALLLRGLRRGPADSALWLQCCLALPPIVLFALVAIWSHQRVMFHWAAPGYLMLFPVLGAWIADRLAANDRRVRAALMSTALLLVGATALIATESRWEWLPIRWQALGIRHDPNAQAINWTSLRTDPALHGLLADPELVLAGIRWQDCGKLGYALGGHHTVICLTTDPREFGLSGNRARSVGKNVLIFVPGAAERRVGGNLATWFARLDALPGTAIRHAGRAAIPISLWLGYRLRVSDHRPD